MPNPISSPSPLERVVSLLLLSILLINFTTQFQIPETCQDIEGLGSPVNIFHQYFRQTMNVFNPKQKKTSVKLLYYRMQRKKIEVHRFVFQLKNTYANRFEYVGIVSVVPKKELKSKRHKHYVIRYINSSDLQDAVTLLGVYEAKKDKSISCPGMKQKWLNYLVEKPYVVTKCKSQDQPDCVTSEKLTLLFSKMFLLIEKILGSFSLKVTTGQLGFDVVILDVFLDVFKDFDFVIVSL